MQAVDVQHSIIALSLCEEIRAFLFWAPQWIRRLVTFAVRQFAVALPRFAVGPQRHIWKLLSLRLSAAGLAGRWAHQRQNYVGSARPASVVVVSALLPLNAKWTLPTHRQMCRSHQWTTPKPLLSLLLQRPRPVVACHDALP